MADNEVIQYITIPALYEQLAEECTELAKASLKMARYYRNENPTPLSIQEIKKSLTEEYTDIQIVAGILQLTIDIDQIAHKHDRWIKRLTTLKEGSENNEVD